MSAWMVDKLHIDYMLTARQISRRWNAAQTADLTKEGQLLLDANMASLAARYGDNEAAPRYSFRALAAHLIDPVQVLKACDCFDYQACEVADYRATDAAALVDEIRADWISRLPGYDDALWGIDAARLSARVAAARPAVQQVLALA